MIVGVPRETKAEEYRVAITPGGVREAVARGHTVLVETGAGAGSSIEDVQFERAGARMVGGVEDVFGEAELVLKVKEPIAEETALLREGQVLFAYLHLAPDRDLTQRLLDSGAVCIAYETVELDDGTLPLLAPMSEVAGRMASQVGAEYLQRPRGGRGVLLGGVPGVLPAKCAVLGGGVVGVNAAFVASGMGAETTILDVDLGRLRYLDETWTGRFRTLFSNAHNVEEVVLDADLVIGAVLVPGARTPWLVTREMLAQMKDGAVVVDVAVDQGGCIETSRPTTHADPVYTVDGVVHYCVANMPGAVPNTSTNALTHATVPYALTIADVGWEVAVAREPALGRGVNIAHGSVTCEPVAVAHGMPYAPLDTAGRDE
jgi:alanine dehydrogenase